MKASKYPLFTQKNNPSDAEIISHKLMLKAGLARQQSSGQYSLLPVGYRVLKKIENIIREENERQAEIARAKEEEAIQIAKAKEIALKKENDELLKKEKEVRAKMIELKYAELEDTYGYKCQSSGNLNNKDKFRK